MSIYIYRRKNKSRGNSLYKGLVGGGPSAAQTAPSPLRHHVHNTTLFSFPPIYSFTQKIIDGDFLKGSTCKELGSHHFSLITSQKLTTEKSTTLLRSIREEMTQVKSLPPRLEKWANTGSHSLLEPKLTSGSLCGR